MMSEYEEHYFEESKGDLRQCPRCSDFMNKQISPYTGASCTNCGYLFADSTTKGQITMTTNQTQSEQTKRLKEKPSGLMSLDEAIVMSERIANLESSMADNALHKDQFNRRLKALESPQNAEAKQAEVEWAAHDADKDIQAGRLHRYATTEQMLRGLKSVDTTNTVETPYIRTPLSGAVIKTEHGEFRVGDRVTLEHLSILGELTITEIGTDDRIDNELYATVVDADGNIPKGRFSWRNSMRPVKASPSGEATKLSPQEEQRRGFAYGNVAIDNPNVTRTMIDEAAERLASPPSPPSGEVLTAEQLMRKTWDEWINETVEESQGFVVCFSKALRSYASQAEQEITRLRSILASLKNPQDSTPGTINQIIDRALAASPAQAPASDLLANLVVVARGYLEHSGHSDACNMMLKARPWQCFCGYGDLKAILDRIAPQAQSR